MSDPLVHEAARGDADAWASLVADHADRVWEHTSKLGARWQAVDASEAAFLTLADRYDGVEPGDIEDWLLRHASDAMRLVQISTWRTPRPVVVAAGEIPGPLSAAAAAALSFRLENARSFETIQGGSTSASDDVVIPWRGEADRPLGSHASWHQRFEAGDLQLDVTLMTDRERRVLVRSTPVVEDCWARTLEGVLRGERDDVGFWRIEGLPESPMSFAVMDDRGAAIATEWVTV